MKHVHSLTTRVFALCILGFVVIQTSDADTAPLKKFPPTETKNLLKVEYSLPVDFSSEWNIVLLSLMRKHASIAEEWSRYVRDYFAMQGKSPRYYNVVLIGEVAGFVENLINNGMRRSLDADDERMRFFMLFTDRERFLNEYGITDETQLFVLLVSQSGETHILARGALSEENTQNFTDNISAYESFFRPLF